MDLFTNIEWICWQKFLEIWVWNLFQKDLVFPGNQVVWRRIISSSTNQRQIQISQREESQNENNFLQKRLKNIASDVDCAKNGKHMNQIYG